MTAATVVVIVAMSLIAVSGVFLDFRALRRVRQAERELADARAHLDWWQSAALNFADRNQTLRRQVAAANSAAMRGW